MSLNVWSLILFGVHVIFYGAMTLVMITKPALSKLVILITSWIMWMVVLLWYGIDTHQIGFILMFVFHFIITLISVVFSAERYMNDNQNS